MNIYIINILLILYIIIDICSTGAPPWQCRVCEDVANTWHDAFPCAGGYTDWGSPISPDIKGCLFPSFDCNKLAGELKKACFSMIKQFKNEPVLERKLWVTMMLHNDPYKTCIELGKCEDESAMPGPTQCHIAFQDKYCKHDWKCTNYTRQCDEVCYICNWLVRDWPLFQEDCLPDGAVLPQSVPQQEDIWPSGSSMFPTSFIQLKTHEKHEILFQLRHKHRLIRHQQNQKHLQRITDIVNQTKSSQFIAMRLRQKNLGKHILAASSTMLRDQTKQKSSGHSKKKTQLTTGFTRTEECYKMWNMFRTTAKGRYFGSWKKFVNVMPNQLDRLKGTMWDANIACKCMGKCELNRFESLGLYEACRYDEEQQKEMRIIARNNNDIAVTEI